MKRDLASVSKDGQSQLAEPALRVYERLSSSKRFKGAVVNGLIVYTRARRPGINSWSSVSEEAEADGRKRLDDEARNDDGGVSARGFECDQLTEVEVREERSVGVEIPWSRKGKGRELRRPFAEDHDIGGELVEVVVREEVNFSLEMSRKGSATLSGSAGSSPRKRRRKGSQVRSSRRKHFTRSTSRASVKPPVENGSEAVQGSEAAEGSEAAKVSEVVPVSEVVQELEVLPVSEALLV